MNCQIFLETLYQVFHIFISSLLLTYKFRQINMKIKRQHENKKQSKVTYTFCFHEILLKLFQATLNIVKIEIQLYIQMLSIQEYLIASVPNLYIGVAALGAVFVFFHLFIILRGFLRIFFRKKQYFVKVYGEKSWVLITGSSQGIGKEFALQFAAQGLNVILLSRTQSKLKEVRQQILGLYPSVQVEIVVADLLEQGKKQNIEDVLLALNRFKNISIVVNNAGSDIFDKYASLAPQTIVDLINTNCFAVAAICYKIRQTGKKCGFINVGSFAGEIPMPMFNVYSASKAYVVQLTNNLSKQYPAINWLALNPSEVSTAMTCFKEDIFTVSSQKCVAGALRDFGHQTQTNGALSHKILGHYCRNLSLGMLSLLWSKSLVPKREEIYKKQ